MKLNNPFLLQKLTIITLAILIGLGLGLGSVYAESKSNLSIPGLGNAGFGATNGVPEPGTYGTSTTSTTVYYINAHIKIWHIGPLLQGQHNKEWYNNTVGGNTNTLYSVGYGDYSVTLHRYKYTSGTAMSSNYYTSYDGNHSCSAAWNTYLASSC